MSVLSAPNQNANSTSPMVYVTYEQPLNEQMRLYLRLERLFEQLNNSHLCTNIEQSKVAMESLLKITELADRPDLKTKLIQTLNQQLNALLQLAKHPHVDAKKLSQLQNSLTQIIENLNHCGYSKLAEPLRKNPFLKSIRLQLGNPAGVCDFNVPAYTSWLTQSKTAKEADLKQWMQELTLLEQAVASILRLTRECDSTEQIIAEGFYHQALNPSLACQMIRLHIPSKYNIFPEISLSKHRFAIRFKSLTVHDPISASQDTQGQIEFKLSCCRL